MIERFLTADVVLPGSEEWGDEPVPEAEAVVVRSHEGAVEFELEDGRLLTFERGQLLEAVAADVARRVA